MQCLQEASDANIIEGVEPAMVAMEAQKQVRELHNAGVRLTRRVGELGDDISQLQRDVRRKSEQIDRLAAAFERYRTVQTAASLCAIGLNLLPFVGAAATSALQAFTTICEGGDLFDAKDIRNGAAELVGGHFRERRE